MQSTQLLLRSILKYPWLTFWTVILGFSGGLFNGVGTLLILPILLELLGQGDSFEKSLPPALRVFTDVFNGVPHDYRLLAMAAAIVLMIVLKNLASYASALTSSVLNQKLTINLRREGLKLLLDVDLDYFSKTRIGDLINHLNGEVNRTTVAVRNIIRLVTLVITVSIFIVILVVTSWQLTLISILALGSVTLLNQAVVKQSETLGQQLSDLSRAYSSRVFEVLSGIRLVKATANEDHEFHYLDQLMVDREKAEYRSQLIFAGLGPFNEVASILALMGIAVLGRMAFNEQLQYFSSVLLTYLLVLFRMMPFVGQLNGLRTNLANTTASVSIVTEFLNRDDKPFMPVGYREFTPLQTGIRFNQVSFKYPSHNEWVIKEIDLFLPKGTTLALVGSSGAGKSTLADLLPRFYDPTAGNIELDGIDLRSFNVSSYRRHLGIVSQDTFLFNASVRDNLLYGRPEATEDELLDAAKRANAYEFITRLPEGFDTLIGDRGVLLSGGQRQRLAIARALLQDPDILILDEATSALDTISERLVQKAIDELSRERTTLVIAHRLSTVHKAQQIAVLDKGQVVELGNHVELLQKGGHYAKLYAMQFSERTKETVVSPDQLILQQNAIKASYGMRAHLNNIIGILGLMMDEPLYTHDDNGEMIDAAYATALDLIKEVETFENLNRTITKQVSVNASQRG
jgi:ATP-binding cassette, subfamily B, bacterial MsbA